jgi:hypothetical protein
MIANRVSATQKTSPGSLAKDLKQRMVLAVVVKKWSKQSRNTKQRVNILKEWITT